MLAREEGFDNINMDIIVGLPQETKEDVENTLEEIKKLGPDNLTVHSLAIKRAARLNTQKEEYAGMKSVNSESTMELTQDAAEEMGMKPYDHGRNADHSSTWCRGHHKGGISKRQDRKMRKCQGYQDLSGKNRRYDRT